MSESSSALLRHRFGANYTPSRNWWYCWNDFEPSAIARDFDALAGLGLDHLRIMLVWPSFQPNPGWVSPAHLDRLSQLMLLAADRGLDIQVSAFTGWLSGFAFKPPFHEKERFYSSAKMWAAQELYVRELSKTLMPHKNFFGFDLGNEMNCCWSAPCAEGDAWMNRVLRLMNELCPGKVHVNGVDHNPWLQETTFSPQALVKEQPIVALHCWTYWAGAYKHGGPLDAPSVMLAAAMAALARAYGNDPAKPMWVQEYGASDEWMDAKLLPVFMERATLAAIQQGVSYFTWWDSHDVDRKFAFSDSLEYGLGLLTVENKVKEHGRMFKQLAEQYRGKEAVIPKAALPPPPPPRTSENSWRWMLEWMKKNSRV
ncbi:MAG TPA: hypothetical protein VGP72_16730 [Planctomycetota bacterium]|jgi:hypothetical protein